MIIFLLFLLPLFLFIQIFFLLRIYFYRQRKDFRCFLIIAIPFLLFFGLVFSRPSYFFSDSSVISQKLNSELFFFLFTGDGYLSFIFLLILFFFLIFLLKRILFLSIKNIYKNVLFRIRDPHIFTKISKKVWTSRCYSKS